MTEITLNKERTNMMSKEEEEDMEAMMRARRSGRSSAFYGAPARSSLTFPITAAPTVDESGLSEPCHPGNCDKVLKESTRLRIGFASTVGRRQTMEDEITIAGQLGDSKEMDYLAVFDGHGGRDAASFASKHLHQILTEMISEDDGKDLALNLKEAFLEVQTRIRNQKISGGSTAIVALLSKDVCYVANAGDSRAVVSDENLGAKRISTDHKPEVPEEKERISSLGGCVTSVAIKGGKTIHRVNGILAVSRALGDIILEPYVTAEPEIQSFSLGDEEMTLVLACDGLWDVVSDEEAVEIAKKEEDPQKSAVKLVEAGITRMSTDNISVIVAKIPPKSQKSSSNSQDLKEENRSRKEEDKKRKAEEGVPQKAQNSNSSSSTPSIYLFVGIFIGIAATWLFSKFS